MNWLGLALGVALFQSLKDVLSKYSLRRADAYRVAFALRFFSLPLLAFFAWRAGWPAAIALDFWWLLVACGIGNGLVTLLYMHALAEDDLGVALPMLAFTPVFLLILSPLLLGEFPGTTGLLGIACIVAGSYMLHYRSGDGDWIAPFRALLARRAARLMLLVSFLWGLTATVDRLGIAASSPAAWGFASQASIAGVLGAVLLWRTRNKAGQTPASEMEVGRESPSTGDPGPRVASLIGLLVLLGCIAALRQISQMYAISLTLTAYVISIKRLSILAGMLFGILLFREETGPARLLGGAMMVAGAAVIGIEAS